MRSIGKVDFESNYIQEFKDLKDINVIFEDDFEFSDSIRIVTRCDDATVWVDQSLIDTDNKTLIRLLPTKLELGYKFQLIPRGKFAIGSVYLLADNIAYKYNLRFNEK